jgi:hypothetical protein
VNCLVDTTVWSLAFRRKSHQLNSAERDTVSELAELVRDGRAQIIGVIRQELLSGIKSLDQFEKLRVQLQSFPDEQLETMDYEAAARASNDCRAKGIAISATDMLICSVSLSRGWSVFTTDPDFKIYSRILPVKLH